MTRRNDMVEVESTPGLRIAGLWRYPVKSLLGEQLPSLSLSADGVDGDRLWGILDRSDDRILTARREPRLLFASSRLGPGGVPEISLPDGQVLTGPGPVTDDALSAWLGKPRRRAPSTSPMPLTTAASRSSGRCRKAASSMPTLSS
jgi:hypothetical protein